MEQQDLAAAHVGGFAPAKRNSASHLHYSAALGVDNNNAVSCVRIRFGYAVIAAWIAFTGYSLGFSGSPARQIASVSDLLVSTLAIYLAWHSYKRPTAFLNCAFAWIALDMGAKLLILQNPTNSQYWMQIIGLIAAVGVVGGAIALRRLSAEANAQRPDAT